MSNDIFKETTKVLKSRYLKHKKEFDKKREEISERNNKLYPEFIEKQRKIIEDKSKDTYK